MLDDDITDSKPRGKYPYLWITWLAIVVGGFFAIEIPALVNDSGGDTLTEHVQYVSGYGWWVVALIGGGLTALLAWLVLHFYGRDSRVWKWMDWRKRQEEENDDASQE